MAESLSEVDAVRKEAIAALMTFGEKVSEVEATLIRLTEIDPAVTDTSNEYSDGSVMRRHLGVIDSATHDLLILVTSLFGRQRVAELFADELDGTR